MADDFKAYLERLETGQTEQLTLLRDVHGKLYGTEDEVGLVHTVRDHGKRIVAVEAGHEVQKRWSWGAAGVVSVLSVLGLVVRLLA